MLTKKDILKGLRNLGIKKDMTVIVHSSCRSLGGIMGGPETVIDALLEAVGTSGSGTLVMPAFTYSYSNIWDVHPFNAEKTPGLLNGILTETLRKYSGTLRSSHPTYSVVAIGKHAEIITKNKENASPLGRGSSYDELFKLGTKILLLGVGNNRNSMLHYAEIVAGLPYNDIPFREFWGRTAYVKQGRKAIEVPLANEFPGCSANFSVTDAYLAEQNILTRGKICCADSMFMDTQEMVTAVVHKLQKEPAWLLCNNFVCEPCTLRRKRLREKGLI